MFSFESLLKYSFISRISFSMSPVGMTALVEEMVLEG